ncbi:hypothetical protein EI94DRAFT_1749144 [Lactarius quietus]|nr:hypothetical protein EI94DRAFT_1756132 [Lactarius quietus]KAF8260245.1 hypothetical protein EI94DRAFT_1749144 [Lactarius quietus]
MASTNESQVHGGRIGTPGDTTITALIDMQHDEGGLNSTAVGGDGGGGDRNLFPPMSTLYVMSSSRAKVVACRRMNCSAPTDGWRDCEWKAQRGAESVPQRGTTRTGRQNISHCRKWRKREKNENGSDARSKSTDSWRQRRVVRMVMVWNGKASKGGRSDMRRLSRESDIRLDGARTVKLAARALERYMTPTVEIVLVIVKP